MIDEVVFIGLGVVLIIAAVLFAAVVVATRRSGGSLDRQKYRVTWAAIQSRVDLRDPATMQLAIVKADALLDQAMRESQVPGSTMAERMKYRQGLWSSADAVWSAHKLRNRIAHESNIHINTKTYRAAMQGFRRALNDLGAL